MNYNNFFNNSIEINGKNRTFCSVYQEATSFIFFLSAHVKNTTDSFVYRFKKQIRDIYPFETPDTVSFSIPTHSVVDKDLTDCVVIFVAEYLLNAYGCPLHIRRNIFEAQTHYLTPEKDGSVIKAFIDVSHYNLHGTTTSHIRVSPFFKNWLGTESLIVAANKSLQNDNVIDIHVYPRRTLKGGK